MARFNPFKADNQDLCEHYPNPAERLADGMVHAGGFALALVGGVALVVWAMLRGGAGMATATSIYAASLVLMLTVSTVYNLTNPCSARRVLRRMDEAAIFVLIAGSYTPFTTMRLEGGWAVGTTAAIWSLALAGVIGKLFLPRVSEVVWSVLYVALGWFVLIPLRQFIGAVPSIAMWLLLAGGIAYTVGVPFFLRQSLPFRRAIWHGFVVAGAGLHFAAVATGVVFAHGV